MALISFEDDNWAQEHDACERLHRNVQTLLFSWSSESRSSPNYPKLSADIRLKLKQFRSEVTQLSELLQRTKREHVITEAEYERRFRQIETLNSKYVQLQNQFSAGIQSAFHSEGTELNRAKQELFSNPSGSSKTQKYKEVNWGVDSDDEDLIGGQQKQTVDQIRNTQTQMLREQDDGLEALSKIISRQRNIAENIGNEVAIQNDIIDDLAEHMDRTNDRMQAETGNIRVVSNRDTTCWYWTLIILLFITIILIVLVG